VSFLQCTKVSLLLCTSVECGRYFAGSRRRRWRFDQVGTHVQVQSAGYFACIVDETTSAASVHVSPITHASNFGLRLLIFLHHGHERVSQLPTGRHVRFANTA
jgi:hypothetical protein